MYHCSLITKFSENFTFSRSLMLPQQTKDSVAGTMCPMTVRVKDPLCLKVLDESGPRVFLLTLLAFTFFHRLFYANIRHSKKTSLLAKKTG